MKKTEENEDDEKDNKNVSEMQLGFSILKKGLKQRAHTKAKLEELKHCMEMDFDSSYNTFRGMRYRPKLTQAKFRHFSTSKSKHLGPPSTKHFTEESLQETVNHYSGIYTRALGKSISKTDKEVKGYIDQISSPFEAVKPQGVDLLTTKTPTDNILMKIKTISGYNRNSSFNFGLRHSQVQQPRLNISDNPALFN